MTLYKILKYIAILIGLIGFVLLARILFEGSDPIKNSASLQKSMLDPFLYLTYITLAATILLVLIFVVKGLFMGNIKETLLSIGSFVVIVIIAYIWANGKAVTLSNGLSISADGAKWVGTGLKTFYILGILALGSMAAAWVKKLTIRK